jgi:solute carrier family 10 (sodium/bile acid cotransporter), member 7
MRLRNAGVLFIPLWLKAMLSKDTHGLSLNIDFWDIFVKLLISFLVPTLIGKVLRELVPAVNVFVKKYKKVLSVTSNTMLALIIWQTLSSGRDIIVDAKTGDMLLVVVSTSLVHVFYLVCNTVAVVLLRVPCPRRSLL